MHTRTNLTFPSCVPALPTPWWKVLTQRWYFPEAEAGGGGAARQMRPSPSSSQPLPPPLPESPSQVPCRGSNLSPGRPHVWRPQSSPWPRTAGGRGNGAVISLHHAETATLGGGNGRVLAVKAAAADSGGGGGGPCAKEPGVLMWAEGFNFLNSWMEYSLWKIFEYSGSVIFYNTVFYNNFL